MILVCYYAKIFVSQLKCTDRYTDNAVILVLAFNKSKASEGLHSTDFPDRWAFAFCEEIGDIHFITLC